ncbi:rhomboid family intramembrane serine protease [Alicyclobacillus sp. SO9]|uniref:rhomboid family intramembrane serine protease n=1 Tax=Alicyclobacillus sp. SO9 TaxID=2665646 RepID=UPI0018E88BD3|nr:rhomboid family intramembrane serine protease [Alicyclobacillus sp. SO9]QQE77088.1 rhomboid family intramembrane serine protease [Alicyclobacillus sp. SO9]
MEYRVKWVHGRSYASWILITMNVLWYLVVEGKTGRSPLGLIAAGAVDYHDVVIGHEWWRLISADFVHLNLTHIGFNMVALAFVAGIEVVAQSWTFITVYVLSGIIGNLAQVLLYPHNTVSAGASGAIMGLYGMALYMGIKGILPVAVRNQVIVLFVVNVVYGFSTPHIGNGAHIGGFFTGLLLAGPLLQMKRISYRHVVNVTGFIAAILSVIALFLAYHNGQHTETRLRSNPLSILSKLSKANSSQLNSTSGPRISAGTTAADGRHNAGTTSNAPSGMSQPSSTATSKSPSSAVSDAHSSTGTFTSPRRPNPVQEFKTEFNKTLQNYTEIRAQYTRYHSQYDTKAITESKYYSDISRLVSPLEADGNQLRYLQMVAPANAKKMTTELNHSATYFYGYIEVLAYSLKISKPSEAKRSLTYLTKSNQAFKQFQTLHRTYLKEN